MKTYTVTAYTRKDLTEGFRKTVYQYSNRKEQEAGFEQISKEIEKLLEAREIVDFQIELNK